MLAIELAHGEPFYINDHQTRVLNNIVSKEMPPIANKWSAEFQDFVKECLNKNPETRWTAEMLIDHPFLKRAENYKQTWINEFTEWKGE